MASDTVPAAAPGPGDTPEQAAPARGLLASLLEPVDPARPTFDLTPTTDTSDPTAYGALTPATQVSSATYHGDGDGDDGSGAGGSGASGRQNQSVLRAWLLAGATRWARGGGTTNQRLAMLKAKAQARQVKTTRTVTVNSSGGLSTKGSKGASGNGSSGSGMGQKQPASKNSSGGAAKSPKNSNGSGRGGSSGGSGSSGSGGRGSSGSSGTGGGRGQSGKNNGTGGGSKGSGGGSGSATGNGSTSGNGKTPKNSNGGRGTKRTDRQSETATCGDSSGISLTKDPKPKKPKQGKTQGGSSNGSTKDTPGHTSTVQGKDGKPFPQGTSTVKDGKDTKAPKADDANGKKISLKKTPKTKTDDTTRTPPADGTGKTLNTQSARETGYRDGTRAGRIVSQVEAYRDGVKDGYTDTRDAAQKEKERLDKAHKDRTQPQAEEPQPVTADPTATQSSQAVSSADDHTPQSIPPKPAYPPGHHAMPWDTEPQPIQVTSVGRDTIQLGTGAARPSISRGEVRTLKGFERTLGEKSDIMMRVADATKTLTEHATGQAQQTTHLVEAARGVVGGDSLIAALIRLQDAANVQAAAAALIHKRAVRGADNCRTVLANAETRYGDIYKAVVNSSETAPAKLSYYQDGETGNA